MNKGTKALYLLPIASLTLISLTIGLVAEPIYNFALQAAEQLLQPQLYIEAVLGSAV